MLSIEANILLHGEFATVNVQDFEGLGFRKVWIPLWSLLSDELAGMRRKM